MNEGLCFGSGVARDWHSGKVRCDVCGRWLWARQIGVSYLAWTPPHHGAES
jgi:hypothetical protein